MLARYFCLTCFLMVIAVTASAQPSPTPERIRTWHGITLAELEGSGEQIVVIDCKGFRSVESFLNYVATLPPDTSAITFLTYQWHSGENKFVAAVEELKKVCDERRIRLHLRTRPSVE